jgi:hypothetical protein
MKTLLMLVLLFILFTISASAQTLDGSYIETSRDQKLTFSGDRVQFNLWTNFCITTNYAGNGTYQIVKGRLFIRPALPATVPYIVEKVAQKSKDSIYFKLTDSLKNPIAGAIVRLMGNGRVIAGIITDINGIAKLSRSKIMLADSIQASFIGYYTARIKYDNLADYNLTMFTGINEEAYYDYLSNHHKGYPIKIMDNSIKVNFKQPGCGNPNAWKEFKKTTDKSTNSITSTK